MNETPPTVESLLDFDPDTAELDERIAALAERAEAEKRRRKEIESEKDSLEAALYEGRAAVRAGTAEISHLRTLSDDIGLHDEIISDIDRDLARLAEKLTEAKAAQARGEHLVSMADAAEAAGAQRTVMFQRFEELVDLIREIAPDFRAASDGWRDGCLGFKEAGLALGLPHPSDWTVTEAQQDPATGLISTKVMPNPDIERVLGAVRAILDERGADPDGALAAAKAVHRLGNRAGQPAQFPQHERLWGAVGSGASGVETEGDPVRNLVLQALLAVAGSGSLEYEEDVARRLLATAPPPAGTPASW